VNIAAAGEIAAHGNTSMSTRFGSGMGLSTLTAIALGPDFEL
jgi:hypothetical protein